MPLLKDGKLIDDPWVHVADEVAVPASGGDLRLALITFGDTIVVDSPLTTDTAASAAVLCRWAYRTTRARVPLP